MGILTTVRFEIVFLFMVDIAIGLGLEMVSRSDESASDGPRDRQVDTLLRDSFDIRLIVSHCRSALLDDASSTVWSIDCTLVFTLPRTQLWHDPRDDGFSPANLYDDLCHTHNDGMDET